jgi:hypothetical protein
MAKQWTVREVLEPAVWDKLTPEQQELIRRQIGRATGDVSTQSLGGRIMYIIETLESDIIDDMRARLSITDHKRGVGPFLAGKRMEFFNGSYPRAREVYTLLLADEELASTLLPDLFLKSLRLEFVQMPSDIDLTNKRAFRELPPVCCAETMYRGTREGVILPEMLRPDQLLQCVTEVGSPSIVSYIQQEYEDEVARERAARLRRIGNNQNR